MYGTTDVTAHRWGMRPVATISDEQFELWQALIEARTGKPVDSTLYVAEGSNFAVDMTVDNLSVASPPILIVADGVVAANTIVGLDTRYGIRRVINAQAQYSAIEQYLMRRATAFRIDYGEYSHRLYDEAFSVMTLTT